MMGARDVVLGLGALTAVKERTQDAEWLAMGAVADAVDAAVSLAAPGISRRGAPGVPRRGERGRVGHVARPHLRRRAARRARERARLTAPGRRVVAPARSTPRAGGGAGQKSMPDSDGIQARARSTARFQPSRSSARRGSIRARGAHVCARSSMLPWWPTASPAIEGRSERRRLAHGGDLDRPLRRIREGLQERRVVRHAAVDAQRRDREPGVRLRGLDEIRAAMRHALEHRAHDLRANPCRGSARTARRARP
ncbi:MAG: hypothetical protein KatS3mg010_1345 [Acidimicrobiia bacterium]|nr:MAG: hypothetical protein KatS3mg010_1345 [Acidimicrobiia bacterium]